MTFESPLKYGAATASLAAVLFMGGSTETIVEAKVPSVAMTSETSSDDILDFESPYSSCNPAWMADQRSTSSAQRCLDQYAGSTVALVNYDLDPVTANDLAEDMERNMTLVTEGLITIDVQVVTPNEQAEALLIDRNPDNCIDEADLHRYGSYIASAVMPELAQYDKVVAESDMKACSDNVGGVATLLYNRYAEIFDSIEDPQDSDIETFFPEGLTQTTTQHDLGRVGLHEMLHLDGLGHAGELFSNQTDLYQFVDSDDMSQPVPIDLNAYIANGQYSEYGDTQFCNIMAGLCGGQKIYSPKNLNPMQVNTLRLPERIVDPTIPSMEHIVGQQPVYFDPNVTPGHFASVKIAEGLKMPITERDNSTDYGDGKKYNTLNIIPRVVLAESGHVPRVWSIDVYLSSEDTQISTVSLGLLSSGADQGSRQFDIQFGEQLVSVVFDGVGVSIATQ